MKRAFKVKFSSFSKDFQLPKTTSDLKARGTLIFVIFHTGHFVKYQFCAKIAKSQNLKSRKFIFFSWFWLYGTSFFDL